MKKQISMLMALAMVLALTACGAGAAEPAVSANSTADVSVSASAEIVEEHEYTAADLAGIVKLDGFGVVQGSVDIDLMAAVEYDAAVVTGITADAENVTYELASAQVVTYTITVSKAALDEKLGITAQESGGDETVVIQVMRRVPVVAPTNCERFLALNPDMVLLTDGNVPYAPEAPVEAEGDGEGPDTSSDDGEQPAATDGETPASGAGNSSGNNSNQAGTSNGGTGSQNNDTTTQPETPSGNGSGSSGGTGTGNSGSQNNGTTSQPGNPSGSSGSGSGTGGSGSSPEPVHTHTWVEQTNEKWVVDQAAWDEPIYEGKAVCNACGAYFNSADSWFDHACDVHDGDASYSATRVQTGTTHHDEVGHYETVVTGYKCSDCGATK